MGTPLSQEADEARGSFARERRRKLQDLSAFKTGGFVPPAGTPFDFGAVAVGNISPNSLVLPSDVLVTVELNAISNVGKIGITDLTTGIDYPTSKAGQSGSQILINHVFRQEHTINIFRGLGAQLGTLIVYFSGPKSQLTQIGQATFT